jgi:hypothetical protein
MLTHDKVFVMHKLNNKIEETSMNQSASYCKHHIFSVKYCFKLSNPIKLWQKIINLFIKINKISISSFLELIIYL